jgi:hypothetical protein
MKINAPNPAPRNAKSGHKIHKETGGHAVDKPDVESEVYMFERKH